MQNIKEKGEKSGVGSVTLIVQNQHNDQAHFTLKKTTALKKLIDAYHKRMGAVPNTYRLLFEGYRINDNDTAESLEIEDMNVIDAMVMTVGGYLFSLQ